MFRAPRKCYHDAQEKADSIGKCHELYSDEKTANKFHAVAAQNIRIDDKMQEIGYHHADAFS